MPDYGSSPGAYSEAAGSRPSTGDAGQPPIVFYGNIDASISLYFDGLAPAIRRRLRFVTPGSGGVALTELADAAAVMFVREFERPYLAGMIGRLRRLGVPLVYFTDDHLGVLRREFPAFTYYSDAHIARFLARCDQVLVSNPALQEALRGFHPDVEVINLALDATLEVRQPNVADPNAPLIVAAPGGLFRADEFRQQIVPALAAIAAQRPVTVIGRRGMMAPTAGLAYEAVPYVASFKDFIISWRRRRPALLLHAAGKTANARFKTPNALLVAHYLGAVPVVAAGEPAYQGIGEDAGLLKAGNTQQWVRQMLHAADPAVQAMLRERLASYCRAHFDGRAQADILSRLLARGAAVPPDERSRRVERASALALADAGGRLAARFASRTVRTTARFLHLFS